MKKLSFLLMQAVLLCFVAISQVLAQQAAPPPKEVLIKAGRMLDVKEGRYLENQVILISGDKIKRIGPVANFRSADIPVIDLSNATVLPGLMDCHAHLLDSWDANSDSNILMAVAGGPSRRALLGAANAREDLQAGFTTVRNIGHSGIDGDVALRDAVNAGWVPGPRILASARKITPTGGQAISGWPPIIKPVINEEFLAVTGTNEARRAVRENLAVGADFIKLVADNPPRVLDLDEMKAIVEEAHHSGVKVAAHATTKIGIQLAIDSGVDAIEHANEATDEQFKAMHDKGIFLDPTLWQGDMFIQIIAKKYVLSDSDRADMAAWVKMNDEQSFQKVAGIKKYGVKFAPGSDMVFDFPGKTRGQATLEMFEALAHFGFSPAEILRADTLGAAELIGWQNRAGSLEEGKLADLIALEGDPLKNISDLQKVKFVMKGGAVARDDFHGVAKQ
ncbi:MAG TPA: amidohydrolase family protein [Candidatus Limnocylindrales bacterium]|nr:amidohydrolase family protein [Candidatus Limnocylindrales bacterium]